MRLLKRMLPAIIIVMSLFIMTAGSASAAGTGPYTQTGALSATAACYGSSCNNQDPYQYSCWGDAYVNSPSTNLYTSGGTLVATIENWYSPSCNANWNQTLLYSNAQSLGIGLYCVEILNKNNDTSTYCPGRVFSSPTWSNMVNGSYQAQACSETDPYKSGSGDLPVWTCGNWF